MAQRSRRDFIRDSSLLVAGGAVTAGLSIARSAHALGSDLVRIGLIGCGRGGIESAARALSTTSGPVKLVAMADLFADRIQAAYRQIKSRHADLADVPCRQRFVGFDAYRHLLASELDLAILATPPAFRPLHFEAAVAAHRHIFLEMPVAVDSPGVRRVLQVAADARQKCLAVAVGLQHRQEQAYQETIAQLQNGLVGDVVALRVYYNGGNLPHRPRHAAQTELEYQLRNWSRFSWLSGDYIVERHVRNLDVGNWLMRAFPVAANAQGGCDSEGDGGPPVGKIFNQFFCEFVYQQGTRMFSQCRHGQRGWQNVSEHVHAARGQADLSGGKIYGPSRERIWQTKAPRGGKQRHFDDLIAALRDGRTPCEADDAAKSTLTAIMGRMAAYRGQPITWEQAFASDDSLANIDGLASLEDPAPGVPNSHDR